MEKQSAFPVRSDYPDRQEPSSIFSQGAQKISTLKPLTVWIIAVAISPPKTGNRILQLSDARSLFSKRKLSRQEKEVLTLLRKTPLTTAHLVIAVECKSWSAETIRSVLDSIDHDGGKAIKVYSEMMYSAKCLESVLKAVFTLRQDRRVVFM